MNEAAMTDSDLDQLYTELCKTLGCVGAAQSQLYLARFAMLALATIGQPEVIRKLIADAADGL